MGPDAVTTGLLAAAAGSLPARPPSAPAQAATPVQHHGPGTASTRDTAVPVRRLPRLCAGATAVACHGD
jgi:hypothetical protein